jgi:hypothetical protein
MTISLVLVDGLVEQVLVVRNPEKLTGLPAVGTGST